MKSIIVRFLDRQYLRGIGFGRRFLWIFQVESGNVQKVA